MIGRFWDKLFKLADYYKQHDMKREYKAISKVQDILQDCYDSGNEKAKVVNKIRMKNAMLLSPIERKLISIDDLMVYTDKHDGDYFYELDKRHFDYLEEIVDHLIHIRHQHKIQESKKGEENE